MDYSETIVKYTVIVNIVRIVNKTGLQTSCNFAVAKRHITLVQNTVYLFYSKRNTLTSCLYLYYVVIVWKLPYVTNSTLMKFNVRIAECLCIGTYEVGVSHFVSHITAKQHSRIFADCTVRIYSDICTSSARVADHARTWDCRQKTGLQNKIQT